MHRRVAIYCVVFLLARCDSIAEHERIEADACRDSKDRSIVWISAVSESPLIPARAPTPTARQLEWQRDERYLFIHFGINTFTGNEWGDGTDDPELFDPSQLDVDQWVMTARLAGFGGVIFTAKHHEGFALWPTAYSDYSVVRSPWKNGKGDLVRMVAEACKRAGIKFGIYLSPWDRHESTYGTPSYDDFFVGQLTELLTGYGPIFEVWLDSSRDPGVDFEYDQERYIETIRRLQPEALVANLGPDIRWVGNEAGIAGRTQYSYIDDSWWYPVECDVSNRPSWFWKDGEDHQVKSIHSLLSIYYDCVGRNGVLLLGVAPNRDGVLPPLDVERLLTFGAALERIFDDNLLKGERAQASNERGGDTRWSVQHLIDENEQTYWATDDEIRSARIELTVDPCTSFNVIELAEPVQFGQRINRYTIDVWQRGRWRTFIEGTTIGHKRLHRVSEMRTSKLRITVHSNDSNPALQRIGLYMDSLGKPIARDEEET